MKQLWLKYTCFFALILMVACSPEEPFDVEEAQQKLSGIWMCIETSGEAYQITIAPKGMLGINISNLCNLGKDAIVSADLLDENNLLIPTQEPKGYIIEGTGTISGKYEKLTLKLSFDDGRNGAIQIVANCTKNP